MQFLTAVRIIINNWTGEGLLVSRAKEAINVNGLVPGLVRIIRYRTLTINVELLEASECIMKEAYELLKKKALSGKSLLYSSLHQKTTIQL